MLLENGADIDAVDTVSGHGGEKSRGEGEMDSWCYLESSAPEESRVE
jgi:hypothetical protein